MLSFDEFLSQYNGQQNVGNTPENKGQCVGLVSVWMDNLGIAHEWGDAKDLFDNAGPNSFEKIANTPDGIPQKGDIMVWSGTFNRGPGHTGIATGTGDTNTFECFEQNDPLGSSCHLKTYNYNYVTGWIRPRTAIIPDTLPVLKSDFETLVSKSSEYDKFVAGGFNHLEDIQKVLNEKEQSIQNLTKDINQCEIQMGQYLDKLQQLNDEDKNTSAELLTAQHAFQPLKDEITAIMMSLKVEEASQILPALIALKASKIKPQPKPTTFLDKIKFLFG